MSDIVISAQRRETGKKASKAVRRNGLIPGVFYMDGKEAMPIAATFLALRPVVYTAETHVIHLQVEGGVNHDCVLKDITFDPVTDNIVHFDLQGLSADRKITVEVPVVLTGQAIGSRDGGLVQHILHKIRVECLPKDMPEHIEVDVTNMQIGDSIHIGQLSLGSIKSLEHDDVVVVSVMAPTTKDMDVVPGTEPALVNEKG
jgi:large subunit ribosomal protein L25